MTNTLSNFQEKLILVLLTGFVFFIPISTALMNIFLYLSVILIIVNRNFFKSIKTSWMNKASQYSVLFFLLFVLGSIWSIADYSEIIEGLSTYKKIFIIFLLLPYLIRTSNNNQLISAFFISTSGILLLMYLIYFNIIDPINIQIYKDIHLHVIQSGGFKTHIITNILLSFTGFLAIHQFFSLKEFKYITLGVLAFYHSIFINDGTTGQILSIALLSILIIQKFKYRSIFFLPLALISIVAYGIINNNTSIYHSINKIQIGVNDYKSGTAIKSVDVRLAMATNGILITKESPWIGTGTGSINKAHINNFDKLPSTFKDRKKTTNPHSEYISISIQLGIVGILLYLYYIYKLFNLTKILPTVFYRDSAQGLLILLLVASFGTSILTDSGEGHFIMIFIAILFSPLSNNVKTNE